MELKIYRKTEKTGVFVHQGFSQI